jgi:hypothetical protein
VDAGDTPLAVTDTHPLIWVATGKLNKLGKAAKRIFDRAAERGDRLIAATAVALELPLITGEPTIAAAALRSVALQSVAHRIIASLGPQLGP